MLRITQLKIERELARGLMALPKSTLAMIDAWYTNVISEMESGNVAITNANDDDLKRTMEVVNYAIQGFRQGS